MIAVVSPSSRSTSVITTPTPSRGASSRTARGGWTVCPPCSSECVARSGPSWVKYLWTEPDPQPEDFDEEVAVIDPRDVQVVEAGTGGKVSIVVSVEGEDAKRLEHTAIERGQGVDQVTADLVRNA